MFLSWEVLNKKIKIYKADVSNDVLSTSVTDLRYLWKAPTVWASTKVSGLLTTSKLPFADNIEVQKPLELMSNSSNPNIMWCKNHNLRVFYFVYCVIGDWI